MICELSDVGRRNLEMYLCAPHVPSFSIAAWDTFLRSSVLSPNHVLAELFTAIPLMAMGFMSEGTEQAKKQMRSSSRMMELLSLYHGKACPRLLAGFSVRYLDYNVAQFFAMKNLAVPTPDGKLYRRPHYSESHTNSHMLKLFREAAKEAPQRFPHLKSSESKVVLAFLSMDGLPLRAGGTVDPRGPCIVGLEKTLFADVVRSDKGNNLVKNGLQKDSFNTGAEEFLLHSFAGFAVPVAVHYGGLTKRRSNQTPHFLYETVIPEIEKCRLCAQKGISCQSLSVREACADCKEIGAFCERVTMVTTVSDAQSDLKKVFKERGGIFLFDGPHNGKNIRASFINNYIMAASGDVFSIVCFRALKQRDPEFLKRAGLRYEDIIVRDRHSTSTLKRLTSEKCVDSIPEGMQPSTVFPPKHLTCSTIDTSYFAQRVQFGAFDCQSGQMIILGEGREWMSYTIISASTVPKILRSGQIRIPNLVCKNVCSVKFCTMECSGGIKFMACWILLHNRVIAHLLPVKCTTRVSAVTPTTNKENSKTTRKRSEGTLIVKTNAVGTTTFAGMELTTPHRAPGEKAFQVIIRTTTEKSMELTVQDEDLICSLFGAPNVVNECECKVRLTHEDPLNVDCGGTKVILYKTTASAVSGENGVLVAYSRDLVAVASATHIKLYEVKENNVVLIDALSWPSSISGNMFFVGRSLFFISASQLVLWTNLKRACTDLFRLLNNYLRVTGLYPEKGQASIQMGYEATKALRAYVENCVQAARARTQRSRIVRTHMSFPSETLENLQLSENGYARIIDLLVKNRDLLIGEDLVDVNVFCTLVLEGCFGVARSGPGNDQMPTQLAYSLLQRPYWIQKLVERMTGFEAFVNPKKGRYYSRTKSFQVCVPRVLEEIEKAMMSEHKEYEKKKSKKNFKQDAAILREACNLNFRGDPQSSIRSFQRNPHGTHPVAFRESSLAKDFQKKLEALNMSEDMSLVAVDPDHGGDFGLDFSESDNDDVEPGENGQDCDCDDSPEFVASSLISDSWDQGDVVACLAGDADAYYWIGQIVKCDPTWPTLRWLVETERSEEEIVFEFETHVPDGVVHEGAILGALDIEFEGTHNERCIVAQELEDLLVERASSSRAAMIEIEQMQMTKKREKRLRERDRQSERACASHGMVVAKSYRSDSVIGKRKVKAPISYGEFVT